MEKDKSFQTMESRDKDFLFALLFGVCRQQLFLKKTLQRFSKDRRPALFALLSLGAYQIFFMQSVTEYAAVNETVKVAVKAGFKREKGFINAVLRRIAENKDSLLLPLKKAEKKNVSKVSVHLSYPKWIVEVFQKQFGAEKAFDVLECLNHPAPVLGKALGKTHDGLKKNRKGKTGYDPYWTIMSPVQEQAVLALDVKPGHSVLDLCSSPGGKARIIIEKLEGKGYVVCLEKNKEKMLNQKKSHGFLFRGISYICSDAAYAANLLPKGFFDRIMLDAPCSNTGEMSKRPEVRWRIKKSDVNRLSGLQMKMLREAAILLKKDGKLIYSTCSLLEEENSGVAKSFLKDNPEFAMMEDVLTLPEEGMPFGGYHAKLKKNEG